MMMMPASQVVVGPWQLQLLWWMGPEGGELPLEREARWEGLPPKESTAAKNGIGCVRRA